MQIYKLYAATANFFRIQVFSYLNKLESTKPVLKKKNLQLNHLIRLPF